MKTNQNYKKLGFMVCLSVQQNQNQSKIFVFSFSKLIYNGSLRIENLKICSHPTFNDRSNNRHNSNIDEI